MSVVKTIRTAISKLLCNIAWMVSPSTNVDTQESPVYATPTPEPAPEAPVLFIRPTPTSIEETRSEALVVPVIKTRRSRKTKSVEPPKTTEKTVRAKGPRNANVKYDPHATTPTPMSKPTKRSPYRVTTLSERYAIVKLIKCGFSVQQVMDYFGVSSRAVVLSVHGKFLHDIKMLFVLERRSLNTIHSLLMLLRGLQRLLQGFWK